MKAFILSDETHQVHWAVLRSVTLILGIVPLSQGLSYLWLASEGSSQIMVGFFVLTLMSVLCILGFYSAVKITVIQLRDDSTTIFKQAVLYLYKHIPMLVFAIMVTYMTLFFISDFKSYSI